MPGKGDCGVRWTRPHHSWSGTFITGQGGRDIREFNARLKAALWADMVINACAGHNRFTLNLHLCKQWETQLERSDPTGA